MKLIESKQNKKNFKPFEITLLIETEREARLLYHVFNRNLLKEAIFDTGYSNSNYNSELSEHFTDTDKIKSYISDRVQILKLKDNNNEY